MNEELTDLAGLLGGPVPVHRERRAGKGFGLTSDLVNLSRPVGCTTYNQQD